jgi:hypothetical protein
MNLQLIGESPIAKSCLAPPCDKGWIMVIRAGTDPNLKARPDRLEFSLAAHQDVPYYHVPQVGVTLVHKFRN